jgi:hypothetical protein
LALEGWNAPSILRKKEVWTSAAGLRLAASSALVWLGGLVLLNCSSAAN